MSTRYQIPDLTGDELSALQDAIVGGAFSPHVAHLTALMVANKGYDQICDNLAKQAESLRRAGHAIMNAKAVN